jgi:hypothetical protein
MWLDDLPAHYQGLLGSKIVQGRHAGNTLIGDAPVRFVCKEIEIAAAKNDARNGSDKEEEEKTFDRNF